MGSLGEDYGGDGEEGLDYRKYSHGPIEDPDLADEGFKESVHYFLGGV